MFCLDLFIPKDIRAIYRDVLVRQWTIAFDFYYTKEGTGREAHFSTPTVYRKLDGRSRKKRGDL